MKILNSVLFGWFGKALTILATFANVRLSMELLGVDGFAAQAILISLTTWLTLLNCGIPTATWNAISKARAGRNDYAKVRGAAVGATFWLAFALVPLLLPVAILINWTLLSPYGSVSPAALWVILASMTLSGLGIGFNQILFAEHRPGWPNLFPAFLSLASLLGLATLRALQQTDRDLVLLVFFLPHALSFCIGAWLARPFQALSIGRRSFLFMLRLSKGYALFGLLLASTSAIDYALISRLASATELAEYALANRLFMGILALDAVILTASWSSLSETIYRGAHRLARLRLRNMLLAGGLLAFGAGGTLVAVMDPVVRLLTGDNILYVPAGIVFGWMAYLLVRVWTDTFTAALLGIGETGTANRVQLIQALVGVPLQIGLGVMYGAAGVIAGMSLGLALTAGWMLPRKMLARLDGLERRDVV